MNNLFKAFIFSLAGATVLGIAGCGGSSSTQASLSPHIPPTPVAHGEWTWVSGSNLPSQNGDYGTKGEAVSANVPPGRGLAMSWTDLEGNLWMFGGTGMVASSTGVTGSGNLIFDLNDLWKFDVSTGRWTWMSGSNQPGGSGVYGTQGIPSTGNGPGARQQAATWTDAEGDFWLFGGERYVLTPEQFSIGGADDLNDLWEYSPTTGQWTWVGGSNQQGQPGVYGTKEVVASGNIPGARHGAVSWTDATGNLWLFGGEGLDANGTFGDLNDLWEYSFTTREWIWMGGADTANQVGVYGTEGIAASGNVPGARINTVAWVDAAGNLWLFGGRNSLGLLNDLWKYSPTTSEWTWVGGSNTINQPGMYGTEGIAAPGNAPGARMNAVAWADTAGNFWLFGGQVTELGSLNDLWKYDPTTNEWTWMSGSNQPCASGVYGTKGVPSASNIPGGRSQAVAWRDKSGNLWFFGGDGLCNQSNTSSTNYNDLWEYQP